MSDDKTEEPTSHRLSEARKKGQVAKSTDIPVAAAFLVAFMFFSSKSKEVLLSMAQHMKTQLQHFPSVEITAQNLNAYLLESAMPVFQLFVPLFALMVIIAIGTNLLQTGFALSTEPLNPKLEKLNPIEGFKKIFSQKGLIEFGKVLLKTIMLIVIFRSFFMKNMEKIINLGFLPFSSVFENFIDLMKSFSIQIIGSLAIVAGLDYLFQYYNFRKEMMMTKQEVKEEYKSLEGDPFLKQRLRARQREMVKRRMLEGVKSSRVVITNPTHFAVALKYKEDDDDAPILVAKGADYMAKQIRVLAEKYKVPIHENPPLARSLYKEVDEGQVIPPDMYMAVAEVIAFVERLENMNSGGGPFGS